MHQVRDNGTADLQMLDQKIQELVYTMNQQTEIIEQLNGDLHQQKEVSRWLNDYLKHSQWPHLMVCNFKTILSCPVIKPQHQLPIWYG